nr:uncharacterized protein LOC115257411 [Aedes albopictus]
MNSSANMDKLSTVKIGLFCLLFGVCAAVKITSLKVPSTYLLDKNSKNPDPLILDCEYDVDENEKGFVLKWFLDGQPVYQWIPTKNPFPFQSFKNRVDTSYVVSQERLHKHRAMAIIKPLANFTGEYACMVQTFASIDRKSAKLKIIVQESKFDLNYYLNGDGYITVDCHARDISPEPELQIRINDKIFETPKPRSVLGENNLYNVSISGSIPKEELESPTMIECYLTVPETNYTKKRSTIYYGKCQTSRKACYCKRFFSPPLFACFFRFCCSWCRRMLLRGYVTYAFLVVVYDGVFFGIVYL